MASTIEATPKSPNTINQNAQPLSSKASPPSLVATCSLDRGSHDGANFAPNPPKSLMIEPNA